MDRILFDKYEVLKKTIASYQSVAIAFSGGVDSTFLLHTAKDVLKDEVTALIVKSPLMPALELEEAIDYCKENHVRAMIVEPDVMGVADIVNNDSDRCYACKKFMFTQLLEVAQDVKARVLIDGSNADDGGDYRPGMKALAELKVKSPLLELGFTKKEIRSLSHALDLKTWDKPSYACLATRIPYGEPIDADKLNLVEKAEKFLHDMGFKEVRVRAHNTVIARIELNPNDFARFMRGDVRLEVNQVFKQMGFAYVSLDLQGYRTGSMNEVL